MVYKWISLNYFPLLEERVDSDFGDCVESGVGTEVGCYTFDFKKLYLDLVIFS